MADFEGAIKQHSQWGRRKEEKKDCELMKHVKLLYRKKKKKHAVYFWSECTRGSAVELIQINKFAFDKTTAAAFAFYTKPALFVTSLSL